MSNADKQPSANPNRIVDITIVGFVLGFAIIVGIIYQGGPEVATLTGQDVSQQYIHDPEPNSGNSPF